MLETDCPYLSPHPKRGQRNEPANVPLIAEALARFLDLSLEAVDQITDASARDLFGLDFGRVSSRPISAP